MPLDGVSETSLFGIQHRIEFVSYVVSQVFKLSIQRKYADKWVCRKKLMTIDNDGAFPRLGNPNWADLIRIDSLFNRGQSDLVSQIKSVAEHGAHVLYPSLEAGDSETVELYLFVTLETAIRVNDSLMERPDIGVLEMGFRVELSSELASKQVRTH